jgi:hypothetical protein
MSRYLGFELIVSKVRSEGACVPAACALLSYHSKTMGLYRTGILPEFRGKGLAQEPLRFSIAIAWTKWIRIFLVQTFIMNDGHTKICKSPGLHPVRQKKNLCKSPRLDRKFLPSLTHISFSVQWVSNGVSFRLIIYLTGSL